MHKRTPDTNYRLSLLACTGCCMLDVFVSCRAARPTGSEKTEGNTSRAGVTTHAPSGSHGELVAWSQKQTGGGIKVEG